MTQENPVTASPPQAQLRSPDVVMRLERLGCAHQCRLSFMRALLRRKAGLGASLVSLGTLHLDLATGTLLADDEAVDLTRRELSILESLMLARGRVVQKQALLDKIGGYDEDLSENAIEQSVSRLRRRLQPHGASIRVARGLGYWLETSSQ